MDTRSPGLPANESSALAVLLAADRHAMLSLGPTIRRLAIGLLDQAVSVRLLACGTDLPELATGALEIIEFRQSPWPFARMQMRRLLNSIEEQPPAIIHALSPTVGALAHALAEEVEAEWVVNLSSADDCRMAAASGQMADAWIVNSAVLSELAIHQCRLPPNSVHIVHPGVPVSSTLACFADDQQEPIILCTAPFAPGSGVDLLLTAMSILRNREITALLFLWGEGPMEGEYRDYVRKNALAAQVTFAHPIGEAVDAMNGADVFVHTETRRAICMDALQAMGRGLAVIAPSQIGCDSLIADKTMFGWTPQTAVGLADVLQRVIQDRHAARAMAKRGLEHIRAHHTVSGMAERVASLYHRLVSQHATIRLKE